MAERTQSSSTSQSDSNGGGNRGYEITNHGINKEVCLSHIYSFELPMSSNAEFRGIIGAIVTMGSELATTTATSECVFFFSSRKQ